MINNPHIGEHATLGGIAAPLKMLLTATYGAPAGPQVGNPVLTDAVHGPVIAIWEQGNSQHTAVYASYYR